MSTLWVKTVRSVESCSCAPCHVKVRPLEYNISSCAEQCAFFDLCAVHVAPCHWGATQQTSILRVWQAALLCKVMEEVAAVRADALSGARQEQAKSLEDWNKWRPNVSVDHAVLLLLAPIRQQGLGGKNDDKLLGIV
eukprot:590342-Amphidinium_carterae.1